MAKPSKDTIETGASTRISAEYIKDFTAKVKALQARFTGKQRRALYNVLKDKGVITEEYTTEMWDNDFKAWKKNPNNGIFRYLEMVSAILDAAQMPAFEVFGGPHARDTDEIIKNVSSRVIEYLTPSLEKLKAYKSREPRLAQRQERVINGKAFENLEKIYELIIKHLGAWEIHSPEWTEWWNKFHFCLREKTYAPFFFLFAWSDLIKASSASETECIIDCIWRLADKIFNSQFRIYYYAYFTQKFSEKTFRLLYDTGLRTPNTQFFDIILNQTLVIAYQLKCIVRVYGLYFHKKKIVKTTPAQKDPIFFRYTDPSTGEEKEDDTHAPTYAISNIKKRIQAALDVKLPDIENCDKKKFMKKIQETKSVFVDLVDCLNNTEPFCCDEKTLELLCNLLMDVILNFNTIMCALGSHHHDNGKEYSMHYAINKKTKEPLEIVKTHYVFTITRPLLDSLDTNIQRLKKSKNSLNPVEIRMQNNLQEEGNKDTDNMPNKIDFTKMRVSRELAKHQLRPNNTAPFPNSDTPK